MPSLAALVGEAPTLAVFLAEVGAGALALALCIRFCPLPDVRRELWLRGGGRAGWRRRSPLAARAARVGPAGSVDTAGAATMIGMLLLGFGLLAAVGLGVALLEALIRRADVGAALVLGVMVLQAVLIDRYPR